MKKVLSVVALVLVAGMAYWLFFAETGKIDEISANGANSSPIAAAKAEIAEADTAETQAGAGDTESGEVEAPENESETFSEEELRAQAEEKLVDDFDAETDKWMDAEKTKPPTMDQINAFRDKFKKLPKDRKEECLHRALNLVPDENVMLLVGILMDKSEDKELVELVYNDVLNRDESVKKPILQMIFKDKEHACWADTAWILDVTGELPEKK